MNYKNEFIKFMSESGVLTFGNFITKSRRNTPYFINTGNYNTGEQINKLGYFYAKFMEQNNINSDVLFGPSYKGIPLCVSVASSLYKDYNRNVKYCFNRKEIKDHGEGGVIIGHKLKDGDNVTIIDDVITAGTAIREVLSILKNTAKVNIDSIVISVDRMEKGNNENSAIQDILKEFRIKVYSIVNIDDIIEAISYDIIKGKEYLDKMIKYREIYGIK